MPSNYTEHYNLNQREAGDRVQRTDFNADNAKIDAALAALASRVEFGAYVGTGRYGQTEASATVLRLGYPPKLLFIGAENDKYTGLFVWPCPSPAILYYGDGVSIHTTQLQDGVSWWLSNSTYRTAANQLNELGTIYHYVAFR